MNRLKIIIWPLMLIIVATSLSSDDDTTDKKDVVPHPAPCGTVG